jgi:hypothetical protein
MLKPREMYVNLALAFMCICLLRKWDGIQQKCVIARTSICAVTQFYQTRPWRHERLTLSLCHKEPEAWAGHALISVAGWSWCWVHILPIPVLTPLFSSPEMLCAKQPTKHTSTTQPSKKAPSSPSLSFSLLKTFLIYFSCLLLWMIKSSVPKVWQRWLLLALSCHICVKTILFLVWHTSFLRHSLSVGK